VDGGISSFFCFAVGDALFPLLPYCSGLQSLLVSLAVGGIGLFAAGALVARFTTRSGGSRAAPAAFGAIAAGATFLSAP